MEIDVIRPPIESATEPAQSGTPVVLPVDADTLGRQIHEHLTPEHPVAGCALCETEVPSRFFIPVKPCCGVLETDVCDCSEFAAEARGVFARNPIVWDLRERRAA
jgi:hypothetical protein